MPSIGVFAENPTFRANETHVEHSGACYMLHSNLRIFSRAISALSKLGSDLYMEATPMGLSLKAFNKSMSAYGVYLFANDFFSEVDYSPLANLETTATLCRISMKCAVAIFKGIQFLDKNYVSFKLWIQPKADTLTVEIIHNCDLSRELEIRVMENRVPFKTTGDKSKLPNLTVVASEKLMSILTMMKSKSDELILSATYDDFILKNFSPKDGANETGHLVKTEGRLRATDTVRHDIREPCEVGFSIKEFMAILTFAAQQVAPLSIYYDTPGRPLVVALEADTNFTSEFIVATFEASVDERDESLRVEVRQINPSQNRTPAASRSNSKSQQQQQQSEGRSIQETKPRHEPTSTIWNPAAAAGTSQALAHNPFPTPEKTAIMAPIEDHVPMGEDLQILLDDDAAPPPHEEPQPMEEEPAIREPEPKRTRNQEFRRFFLNYGEPTQRQSQAFHDESIMVPDSPPKD